MAINLFDLPTGLDSYLSWIKGNHGSCESLDGLGLGGIVKLVGL